MLKSVQQLHYKCTLGSLRVWAAADKALAGAAYKVHVSWNAGFEPAFQLTCDLVGYSGQCECTVCIRKAECQLTHSLLLL